MELEQLLKQGEYVACKLELCHSRGQRRGFFPREFELSGNSQLAGRAAQQRLVCFKKYCKFTLSDIIVYIADLSAAESCRESKKVQSKGGSGRPMSDANRERIVERRGEALAVMDG